MSIKRVHDKRQAVIIIHGMGEQRPMGTLRGFLKGTHDEGQQFYSRPFKRGTTNDNRNYDLRRFSTSEIEDDIGETARLKTDFYELYWAHFLGTGSRIDTLKWTWHNTMLRPFWKHNSQLKLTMAFLQVIGPALVIFWLGALFSTIRAARRLVEFPEEGSTSTLGLLVLIVVLAGLVSLAGILVPLRFHSQIRNFLAEILADPPRYFVPHPRHIKSRNEIRDEGVRLLRQLHEAGFYERVVVVGHSLGSVVGLDMLRLTWDEYRHPDPDLQAPDDLARTFTQQVLNYPQNPITKDVGEFQKLQHALWKESRARGVKWLVTDFITLGSPLAHADWLMFEDDDGVKDASFDEREYPRCPPDIGRGIFYGGRYVTDSGDPDALVSHHAAPFSVTRWSNVYFPVKGLYGDPVGGDIAPIFGSGVSDIRVRIHSLREQVRSGISGRAHTQYWNRYLDPHRDWEKEAQEVTRARKALDLKTETRVAHLVLQQLLDLDFQHGEAARPEPVETPHSKLAGYRRSAENMDDGFLSREQSLSDSPSDAIATDIPAADTVSQGPRVVVEDADSKAIADVSAPLV